MLLRSHGHVFFYLEQRVSPPPPAPPSRPPAQICRLFLDLRLGSGQSATVNNIMRCATHLHADGRAPPAARSPKCRTRPTAEHTWTCLPQCPGQQAGHPMLCRTSPGSVLRSELYVLELLSLVGAPGIPLQGGAAYTYSPG